MTRPVKTLLSWSSGKDSAWALHTLRQDPSIDVVGLFTTVNSEAERVAIHGVRQSLLEAQAQSLGLPLYVIPLPYPCSNEAYQACMARFHQQAVAMGVEAVAFGDLLLEDVRDYRIEILKGTGLEPRFPLWGEDTGALARTMVASGLRATLSCIQNDKLSEEFLGREFDSALLDTLPDGIDPCGENGEFHTFAWDGPMFRYPLPVVTGERVIQEWASFVDLLPLSERVG
ncbi:adenine nucleotide alpha hydrolase [Ferrimonas balearica]|uniref:Dph6-related ATP pyrophosphatase n=1 Tax=Ferrimonas balearica TaxID=44012 RepID=UPI001C9972D5|nr:adenine nucleotide alpha hydrolase [Ferrimonas balearica]MBY5921593.1 adenine nucleotide alpha hydrolase [Ferrimonas balearica]MBY5995067.1 adenine nucleotide alpha hydrolase [Ferrimonas balearica]